ncbi:MAG TPA: MBG domain-containing protein, partial [Deltaproteobacteria bacterium]|nr:MBG domain-containing protein [Deltaproteobacteria bacterium]
IATLTGDLTLTGSISTTNATIAAITLNAGKSSAAGISTGGNIIISGNPTITTGAGGRATLYSGGVSGSTGLTDLIGSATGRFRYHSDETTANYVTILGSGTYAIYREQPTVTITAVDVSRTYDASPYSGGGGVSFTGFVNGDTSSVLGGTLAYGGGSQGAVNAGTYTITPGGYSDTLGYALGYAEGSLTITPAALTVTANSDTKTYDGAPYSGGGGVSISGLVGGETSSVLSGTLSYGGTSQGASLPGVYTIRPAGLSSENYAITFVDGLLVITSPSITDTVVAGLVSTPTGTNGTGQVIENIGSEPALPSLGPGAGSDSLAAYSAAALVITPPPGMGGMILSSATLTSPVAFGRQDGAFTLTIGGSPDGDLIEIGSVPVFARAGAQPPRLEGAYVVGESPSALSLTAAAAGSAAAPEVSGLEGARAVPFSLTLEGGVALSLRASLTPQGLLVITVPDSASALDLKEVVLMGLQTVRQELKTDLKQVKGVVVIQE